MNSTNTSGLLGLFVFPSDCLECFHMLLNYTGPDYVLDYTCVSTDGALTIPWIVFLFCLYILCFIFVCILQKTKQNKKDTKTSTTVWCVLKNLFALQLHAFTNSFRPNFQDAMRCLKDENYVEFGAALKTNPKLLWVGSVYVLGCRPASRCVFLVIFILFYFLACRFSFCLYCWICI